MAKKISEPTQRPRERAFLVGVEIKDHPGLLSLEASMEELALLADTAGLEVVGETTQRLDHPNPSTYIGSGKVTELVALVEETMSDVVVFDSELSPRHLRDLEEHFSENIHILDRTALILDIFAQHAHTSEGILQVKLAQLEYRLPRLTRAWTHLARQAGGGGGRTGSAGGVGLRGPGETQLEVDRREVRHAISSLKEELEKVRSHRMRYRLKRKHNQVPITVLVGYTNAGKSTLLNRLTKANVYVADKLFATLDPTTRRIELPGHRQTLFTDTVGFIQKLPTQLVASFRATLEEISESDLLLHVVDITHPDALSQWKAVQQTLREINADKIPIVTALNKIDRLSSPLLVQELPVEFSGAIPISALTGEGIPDLLRAVEGQLFETFIPISVRLPYKEGQLISIFHEQGQINRIEQGRGGVLIQGSIPGRLITRFQPFLFQNNKV